jgi:hypothetical protein
MRGIKKRDSMVYPFILKTYTNIYYIKKSLGALSIIPRPYNFYTTCMKHETGSFFFL